MVQLNLLGGAVLEDSITIGTRRHPLALLALLATAPAHTLSRGRLVGLLWPETPEKTARNRLTSCIYEVRSALGDDVLLSSGDDLHLDLAGISCDVCRFEDALANGDSAAAVAAYGGPLLDGFRLGGSAAFEQHIDVVRDRLHRAWLAALEATAKDASARGDTISAIDTWRERVRQDPWDSRVVHRLMEALVAAGSPAEALRIAREHERALAEELGTEPAPAVRDLVAQLQAARDATPAGPDLEAYRIYAQGRGLLDQRTGHEIARSVDYFRRAIERDASFALAWSGLADALAILEFYDFPLPRTAPDALAAAQRAVELGPSLGQAHASLGIVHAVRRAGGAALEPLQRAVRLAPDHAEAYAWLGWVLLMRGSADAALEPARAAVELDPLAPAYRVYLGETWLANGRVREALREAVRARELQPGYALAHFMEGLALYHLGRLADADASLARALHLGPPAGTPTHAEIHAALGIVRTAADDAAAARALLARIRAVGEPFSEGLLHAALGETDAAFDAFDRVTEWDSFSVEHARYFFPAVLGPLRDDARWTALTARIDAAWDAAG